MVRSLSEFYTPQSRIRLSLADFRDGEGIDIEIWDFILRDGEYGRYYELTLKDATTDQQYVLTTGSRGVVEALEALTVAIAEDNLQLPVKARLERRGRGWVLK